MNHAQPASGRKRDRAYAVKLVLLTVLGWVGLTASSLAGMGGRVGAATYDQMVKISAVVGFNSFFGKNNWVPVRLKIDNPGRATSAELRVDVSYNLDNGRMADGTLRWSVELPAKKTTFKEIYVPGSIIDNASVSCTADGQTLGAVRLSGNALGNTALVAVLSKEAQSAQFLTGSTGPAGAPVLPISVSPSTVPQSANLLNDLAALFATPEALNDLTVAQQGAVLQWVKLGGLLVVTGTAKEKAPWQVYMPVLPGPSKTTPGEGLIQMFDSSAPVPPTLTTFTQGMKSGSDLWAGTSSLPLVAALKVSRGMVVQTSFLPSQASLLGWSSNASFWTQVLKDGSSGNTSALPSLLDKTGILNLATASDALTPLRIPSLRVWALLFGMYALVVGPGLFFILRRKKRETLAWAILPALSILTTIGIYGFGASQRPSGALTEGVGVMDLLGDGTGEVYGVRGFMFPYVSNTTIQTHASMLVLPLKEQNVRQLGTANVTNGRSSSVSFEDVGRWGIRYVYSAGAVNNLGEFQTELEQFGNLRDTFRGLVSNDTPYPMHDVAVYWNRQLYLLGDINPSVTVPISTQTQSQNVQPNWLSAYSAYNRDITHGIGRPLGSLANQLGFMNSDLPPNQAILIATTDVANQGLPKLPADQKISSSQGLVLVRQIVEVTQYPPEVTMP